MTIKIRRAAVLGAGVMGAQIAAHLAAAGVRTHLLDLGGDDVPEDKKLKKALKGFAPRSWRAVRALGVLQKLKPSPLMTSSVLEKIIPGNFEDDMSVLADCDWVIEAIVERIDIKKKLFAEVTKYARPGVPITSNTSGIPVGDIAKTLPEEFQTSFFGVHFFNPPRYMKLVEVIPQGRTNINLLNDLSAWIEFRLGKGIVHATDSINFIGNRIGVLGCNTTIHHAERLGINIEEVDALTGKLWDRPKSATFRTLDVVGLDTYQLVAKNVYDKITDDPYHDFFKLPSWMEGLIEDGHFGSKSGCGTYKRVKEKGKSVIHAYRPETKTWVPAERPQIPWLKDALKQKTTFAKLSYAMDQNDKYAELVRLSLADVVNYSTLLVNDIASSSPKAIDDAMRWGYGWKWGPLELYQGIGTEKVHAVMQDLGRPTADWLGKGTQFYKPSPNDPQWERTGLQDEWQCDLKKYKKIESPLYHVKLPKKHDTEDPRYLMGNDSISLMDIGDGIACLTFHSKMNSLNTAMNEFIPKAIAHVNTHFEGMVVANDGQHFSAGADLSQILTYINDKNWDAIDKLIRTFQGAMQLLKFAPFPVVGCPHGMVLGGGCEVSLHTHHRVAASETYAGLVEMGVGLIPAAGGCKEFALRAYDQAALGDSDPFKFLQKMFMLIGLAKVSASGDDAVEAGIYGPETSITMNRDRQTAHAKLKVIEMLQLGFRPKLPRTGVKVLGNPGVQTFRMMLYNMLEGRQLSEHDAHIATQVAKVLCGGEIDGGSRISEQQFLNLERVNFVELCKTQKTKERIEHMLKKGKPLRN